MNMQKILRNITNAFTLDEFTRPRSRAASEIITSIKN